MRETTEKLPQAVFCTCVKRKGCVVCEQHLADEHVCDFCFRTQWGKLKIGVLGWHSAGDLGYKLGFVFHVQLHIVVEALKRMRQI